MSATKDHRSAARTTHPSRGEARVRSRGTQRHGISMSALVRINALTARERREREAMSREMYPRV